MKIIDFKDIHKGQRCFVIGTGPSLNQTNLSLLENEIIFGVNTLYRGLTMWDLKCKYYGVSDIHVLRNHYEEIAKLDTTLFLALYAAKDYLENKKKYSKINPVVIEHRVEDGFSLDPTKGIHWGSTVVYDVGLHMTYYMGFQTVYLVGVDCDYSKTHHFDGSRADFIGLGSAGNWTRAFESYPQAKKAFEADGRKVYNATVGGNLEIFERKQLESIFVKGKSNPGLSYLDDQINFDTSKVLLIYAWYHKMCLNIENGKPWYWGFPYTWWWGLDPIEFLKQLPAHLNEEEDWNIEVLV